MNNVWATIAFRAPCAARQSPRKPLLQLFNGYARNRPSKHAISTQTRPLATMRSPLTVATVSPKLYNHGFTTTAVQSLRNRPTYREPKPSTSDSKLEPATTVASHTEGIAEDAEGPLTWRDYDPAGGMPLPNGELSQPEINGVFDSEKLDADTGNYILNVMYWRRMSGALIDSELQFPKNSRISREQALKGLEYVRSLDPGFDERAAGQTWAEEESLRLQEQLREKAVKMRLYKEEEPAEEVEEEEESDQGTEYGRERNRDSALVRMREENVAWLEQEEARKQAVEEAEELSAIRSHRGPLELGGGVQPPTGIVRYTPGGITIAPPQNTAWLQPIERKPWVKYYEDQAQIIKDNRVPQMSLLRRLGPSFLIMAAIISAALYLSETYTPPPKSARMFPETPPAVATLAGLTGTLAIFFILSRFPPLWRSYSKYFTLVPAYPYAISIVGAAFRHQPLSHLLTNCASVWLLGLLLHEDVGRGTFLAVFFASGAVGGFTSLTYNVLRKNWMAYIFGSSSCVLGVVAAACTLRPNGTIRVWGYDVPIAAWLFLAVYGVGQTVVAWRGVMPGIDHAGHLGGLAAGLASALLVRRKVKREREQEHRIVEVAGHGTGLMRAVS